MPIMTFDFRNEAARASSETQRKVFDSFWLGPRQTMKGNDLFELLAVSTAAAVACFRS